MALDRITVGIDRSGLAREALQWATDLAACSTGTAVRAIGTWEMPLIASLPRQGRGQPTAAAMAGQARDRLVETVDSIDSPVEIEQVVIEGPPGDSLVAESQAADLLVVGRTGQGKRHGLSRLAEIALGSTARHCVHHAACPIATVPNGSVWPDPATVVVGLDGSESSFGALAWALTKLPPSTEIHVLHVFAPWVGDGLTPRDLDHTSSEFISKEHEVRGWVRAVLDAVQTDRETDPVVEVTIGSARDALADPGYPIDAIVVGERGHTGIAARVLGSIADHVVRYAPRPVIVVPDER